jgi:hypothetical protein
MMNAFLQQQRHEQSVITEDLFNEGSEQASRMRYQHYARPDFARRSLESAKEPRRLQPLRQTTSTLQATPISSRISSRIAEAIESSRNILNLKDDWDEEGSPGYKESTWNRATEFVKDTSLSFRRRAEFWVDPPRILPGPKGSIDIHWRTSKRELLINIPENDEEPADYYGSGGANDIIKGKLDTSSQRSFWILAWLMR